MQRNRRCVAIRRCRWVGRVARAGTNQCAGNTEACDREVNRGVRREKPGERSSETRLKVDGMTGVGMTTPRRVAVNARFACERHWLMNPTAQRATRLYRPR